MKKRQAFLRGAGFLLVLLWLLFFPESGKAEAFSTVNTEIPGTGLVSETFPAMRSADASLTEGTWVQGKNQAWFWKKPDGSILREGGWHVLNGKRYFLAANSGRRKTGWVMWNGKTFYLDPKTGIAVTGWKMLSGKRYYFSPKGKTPGIMQTGTAIIAGKQYFFNTSGTLFKGWKNIKDRTYYYTADGSAAKGWTVLDGKKYYFNPDTCTMKKGWLTIGENKYYFRPDGTLLTGYLNLNGRKYLFLQDGKMARGWLKIGNHRYYFDQNGVRAAGFTRINGKTYYFNPKWGYMMTGKVTVGGKTYQLGSDGTLKAGLQSIGGKLYYFREDGTIAADQRVLKIGDSYYEAAADGELRLYTGVWLMAIERLNIEGWDLYSAYQWCARKFVGIDDTIPEGREPAEYFASWGFERSMGDCYVMAAMLYHMAYLLGEDAHFVMGYVPLGYHGELGPHGWCEIDRDGVTYICDPDLESEARKQGVIQNGFMFTYGTRGTYRYTNGQRMP